MPCLQHRNTLRTFTSCTRCQASSEVSSTLSSSLGLMPALLNSTSMRPNSSRARAYMPATWSSSVTSAAMRQVADGVLGQVDAHHRARPPPEQARGLGADAAGRAGDHADLARPAAPSALLRGVDRRSSRRCSASSACGPSSRPTPDCLKPPNGVLTRTEVFELIDSTPGVERARHAQRLGAVAGPDRAAEPVDRVVGLARRRRPRRRTGSRTPPGRRSPPRAARSSFDTGASTVGGNQ